MTERLIGALCAPSSRLDRHCREALRDIAAIDGIELTPQPTGNRGPGLSLSFRGWSPSLHFAWTVAYEPIPPDADEEGATDSMIAAFDSVIRRQALRARDADAIGHAAPLRNGMVEHLQIDRATAAVYLGGREDRELEEFVRSAIGSIHRGTTIRHDGGATLGRIGQLVGESVGKDGTTLRFVAPKIKIYGTGGRPPTVFTGHHLRLHADRLPETVLSALVGRPLSTLAEVHPGLDGRTIRHAENDERPEASTILIGLDQHLVPVATKEPT